MYFISNTDGIPVLSALRHEDTIREATEQEVRLYTDFWTEYLDRVETGESVIEELDEEVRLKVLRNHGHVV